MSASIRVATGIIQFYQEHLSEDVGAACRFRPTCSRYMLEAIQQFGVIKGVRAGLSRLRRCNGRNGGYDPPITAR